MGRGSVKTIGLTRHLRRLKKAGLDLPGRVELEVFSRSSGRTAAENTKIARVQRSEGRDPWFLDSGELSVVMSRTAELIGRVLSGGVFSQGEFRKVVGGYIVDAFKRHILLGKSSAGPMKGLSEKYSKQKLKKHGFTHPILVATGALLKSIDTRIRIRR